MKEARLYDKQERGKPEPQSRLHFHGEQTMWVHLNLAILIYF